MTRYEHLEQLAHSCGVRINLSILREEDALDGLYVALRDGGCLILINRYRTQAERTAALAEELGHHFRSIGDLRDLRDIAAAKAEAAGQAWSIDALLPRPELEIQIRNGNGTSWQLAEATDLPEDFVRQAVSFHAYRQPRRVRARDLPPQVQEIVRNREARAAQAGKPTAPPGPRPSADEIRPKAKRRAARLLGRKLRKGEWQSISYAYRNELIFNQPGREYIKSITKPNPPHVSRFIRAIYKEIFEEVQAGSENNTKVL